MKDQKTSWEVSYVLPGAAPVTMKVNAQTPDEAKEEVKGRGVRILKTVKVEG